PAASAPSIAVVIPEIPITTRGWPGRRHAPRDARRETEVLSVRGPFGIYGGQTAFAGEEGPACESPRAQGVRARGGARGGGVSALRLGGFGGPPRRKGSAVRAARYVSGRAVLVLRPQLRESAPYLRSSGRALSR